MFLACRQARFTIAGSRQMALPPVIRLVAKLTCGGLARLFVTNKDKN
jgi:hypothetical protein